MGLEEFALSHATPDWVYFLVVALLLAVIAVCFMVILRGAVKTFLNRKRFKDRSLHKAEGFFIIVMVLIGIDIFLQKFLFTEEVFLQVLRTVIVLLFTLIVIELSHFLLEVWGSHMTRKKGIQFEEEVLPVTHSVVKIVLFLIGFIIILQLWGVQIWTLLASIGIMGIILGLALKDSLEDVFGGITLIMDKTFKAGDVIQLETGEIGEVVMVNLRSTRILTIDEKIVSIPNGILANAKIMNYSQPTNILRVEIPFSVAYGSDPEKVAKVIKDDASRVAEVLSHPPPDVKMTKMGDHGLEFRLEVFIRFHSIKELEDLKGEVTARTYLVLRKNKIVIPYPTKVSYSVALHGKEAKEMKKLL